MPPSQTPLRPLAEPRTRHPYDFWFRGPDGDRAPFEDVDPSIRPVLFKVLPRAAGASVDPNRNSDIAQFMVQMEAMAGVTLLPHDFAHCIANLRQFAKADLLVFARTDVTEASIRDRLQIFFELLLCDVSLVRTGALCRGDTSDTAASGADATEVARLLSLAAGPGQDAPSAPAGAPLVVTAIVDHAIAFANARFNANGQSRIVAHWAQQFSDPQAARKPVSATSSLGCVLNNTDIEALLGELASGALLDEDALYDQLGLGMTTTPLPMHFPLGLSFGHGTQVLDTAAGQDPLDASDFPQDDHGILSVQLPAEVVARTNGYMTELWVKSALNWIWAERLKLADATGRPVHVIFNYSFAVHGGRHDGQELLEADLEIRCEREEFALVTMAAGNSYLSRTYAEVAASELGTTGRELTLAVQPDDAAPTFVYLCLPAGIDPGVEPFPLRVTLTAPNGATSSGQPGRAGTYDALPEVQAEIYYLLDDPLHLMPEGLAASRRATIVIAINPTSDRFYDGLRAAPPGDWTIALAGLEAASAEDVVDLWVERGDTPGGFPDRGRQAYFRDPDYRRFAPDGRPDESDLHSTGYGKRLGTLSGIATAATPLAVASVRSGDLQMSRFSSARSDRMPEQPGLAAVSERSLARPHILTAGSKSGSIEMSSGTSFACAIAARTAALALLSGATSHVHVRQYLIDQALNPEGLDAQRIGAGFLPVPDRQLRGL